MTPERWNETELLALGSTLFALAFSYPLLGHLSTAGMVWDWTPNMQMAWAAWNSVVHLHQFPMGSRGCAAAIPFSRIPSRESSHRSFFCI